MRRTISPLAIGLMLVALEGTLAAQAMVENALGAGRAATTTAPARALGKSVGGVTGSLDKMLKGAPGGQSSKVTVRSTSATPKTTAAPARKYEDPKLIEAGLTYDELIQRFGPPALQMTSGPGSSSLNYAGKEGAVIQVEVQDGKVSSVDKPKS